MGEIVNFASNFAPIIQPRSQDFSLWNWEEKALGTRLTNKAVFRLGARAPAQNYAEFRQWVPDMLILSSVPEFGYRGYLKKRCVHISAHQDSFLGTVLRHQVWTQPYWATSFPGLFLPNFKGKILWTRLNYWCEIAGKIDNYPHAIIDQCLICRLLQLVEDSVEKSRK